MKALGLLLKVIAGFVAIVVVAVGVIIATVDPNDYREEIVDIVKKETGRDFTVTNMSLSIFPQFGINLEKAALSNADGFSAESFVKIEKVQLGAAILPLLSQQLEVDTLTVHGLALNLERNETGVNNWDDLSKPSEDAEEAKEEDDKDSHENPMDKLASLNFGGIDIQNGQINWNDAQAKQSIALKEVNFTSGSIRFGEFFPISFSAQTDISQPQISTVVDINVEAKLDKDGQYSVRNLKLTNATTGQGIPVEKAMTTIELPTFSINENTLSLSKISVSYDVVGGKDFPLESINGQLNVTDLTGDIEKQAFNALSISLSTNLQGESIPGGKADVTLQTAANIDLMAQTASLTGLSLNAMELSAKAEVRATQITENTLADVSLAISQTDLRALLKKLNIALPEMSDNKTLTKFASDIALSFDQKAQKLAVKKIDLQLDDSKLTGNLSVANFSAPKVRYDLALDTINVNRYLPPKKEQPETQSASDDPEIELPVEMMRKLDIIGTVKVGSVTYDKLQPKNILMTLKASKGNIQANPIRADIFKTRINSQAGVNVSGKTPKYNAKVNTKNVPVGEVLMAFADTDRLSGTGSVDANITTSGNKVSVFKKTLNGTVNVNLQDGAIKGFNLAQAIRNAQAKISGKPAEPTDPDAKTDFSSLIASASIKNGMVTTKKLALQAPFMRVNGSGTVNLAKETLNYLVKTKIVASDKGQGGEELKDLNGLTLPVKLTGNYKDPSISLDLGSVLEQKAQAEIENKKEEIVNDAKKQVEDKLKDSLFKGFKF